ncbi:RNase H-like protein [Phytophthora sojae]|uniref:ribonuclease H n=1 Tax=Phytophthora sojae (strain P6497) TaxID=1094619 RepID=G4Z6L4_PHYSP|nr:RNase H-like protein [Phytophthora sojae]EGZ19584.1 RNase H-like protein [Phytophthora sojae]|eukprot:XP_009522301.1 RNase H-like protein [Phytophthora sojae]
MDGGWFYAVAVGRSPGIYRDWQEARRQVDGYSGGKWKKFGSSREAADYLRRLAPMGMMVDPVGRMRPDGSWTWAAYRRGMSLFEVPDPKKPDSLVAFCDGSAMDNGQYNCHAAYACIFPHNRSWDVVETVKGPFATSNRAEYLAALEAFKRANIEDPKCQKTLMIYTDSELLVNSMGKWVIDWMYDGWVTSTGTPVKNRDLLQALLEARGNSRAVMYEHVRAHSSDQD